MAKNLKLNIKNTQLAAALKLSKPVKSSFAQKGKEVKAAAEEKHPLPITPPSEAPLGEKKNTVESIPTTPSVTSEPFSPPIEATPIPKRLPPPPAEERGSLGHTEAPPRQPHPVTPIPSERQHSAPSSIHRPAPSFPRRENTPYPQRDSSYTPYPRREGGYNPGPRREGGYNAPPSGPRREGGYTPGPRRDTGYTPSQGPRREGGYTPGPRRDAGGYTPGYTPGVRREGGYTPGPRRPGYPPSSNYPFRRDFRPMPPISPRSIPLPPKEDTSKKRSTPDDKGPRKPGFKEYRDVKPSKKTDAQRAFDSRDRQGLRSSEDEEWRKKRQYKQRMIIEEEVLVRPKQLKVRLPITLKDLAVAMKLKASELVAKLFIKGVVLTLNDYLDDDTTVQLLGHEFGCEIVIDTSAEERLRITDKTIKQEIQETPADHLIIRPPVVAFMGHVDHGKTSLIDTIRKTNVAAAEAGAITQHIGAFKCQTAVGDITILDTPGHEAFSAMRSRGADVTDIAVLVIAGDEGIRAQTIEALQQATEAKVSIMIAINKSDKPNFNAENIYRQLADHQLVPEVWGGSTITVNCSGLTGAGVKELLEMLALQAEVLELKANPAARARGTVIESQMHKGLGAVATVLVQNGTLKVGDSLVFAQHWARVKTMHDEHGKQMLEAGPSTPVKITGLSGLPAAGSEFIVVKHEKDARDLAQERTEGHRSSALAQTKKAGLENLLQQKADSSTKKILTLILRADVQGSLEALKTSLLKIDSKKVEVNIISAQVGEISESDIQLAAASKATLIGFHTQVESHADFLIKQHKVTVRLHDIIYHAVDDVKEIMTALLDKIPQETDVGKALVKTTFKASQLGVIAGCQVSEGTIQRNHSIRVMRQGKLIWKGPITSLKRVKDDVREVSKGMECGILLQHFNDVKEGDELEAYEITYLEQTL